MGHYYALKGGIAIPEGADLKSDTYKVPGNYYCNTDVKAKTLINCPSNIAFILKVEYGNGIGYVRQIFKQNVRSAIIVRSVGLNNDWTDEETYITNSDLTNQIGVNPVQGSIIEYCQNMINSGYNFFVATINRDVNPDFPFTFDRGYMLCCHSPQRQASDQFTLLGWSSGGNGVFEIKIITI